MPLSEYVPSQSQKSRDGFPGKASGLYVGGASCGACGLMLTAVNCSTVRCSAKGGRWQRESIHAHDGLDGLTSGLTAPPPPVVPSLDSSPDSSLHSPPRSQPPITED